MTVTNISKWGNSQGIRLSKKMLKQIGVENIDNEQVTLTVNDGKIIIEKTSQQSKLMQRFADYDPQDYLKNREIASNDLPGPKGREIW
ncbi:AbrB/MazE/SpoVT family DNA-binding domain-containing protein [Paucilactobacillus nenjiangensis]|uniref:AbrB/MazE/SpoVT family DNA-binding domain-containing protein n=1 Tax=Paucilactobacillus nenjiangensis TaxID=1296540 RepID=UPI0010FA62CD|nr:AbrB/MazE/SpoVT family DNA-binding domain-containing protein [Paucilactobacillus nenjiangensis]